MTPLETKTAVYLYVRSLIRLKGCREYMQKSQKPKQSLSAAVKLNVLAAYVFLSFGIIFATAIMIAGSLESALSEFAGLVVSLFGALILSRSKTPAFARQRP